MILLRCDYGIQRLRPSYEAGFANELSRIAIAVTLVGSDEALYDKLAPSIAALNLRGSQDLRRPTWRKALNLVWYGIRLFVLVARHRTVKHPTY